MRQLLTSTGYTAIEIDPVRAPMWFGTGADDAYAFILGLLGWMLEGLDENGRDQARSALRATIDAHSTTGGVGYESGTCLIRAQRT